MATSKQAYCETCHRMIASGTRCASCSAGTHPCPGCGKHISGYPCVFCGQRAPGDAGAGALVVVLAFVVIVGFAWLAGTSSGGPGGASEPAWQPDGMGAFVACQDFVERRLVSPSTADWPAQSTADISRSGDRFRVRTHVDSENRMGGTVRSEVDCTVEPSGEGRWQSVNVSVQSR